jgi:Holliday junction resolvase-like predicted endonuclease
MTYTFKELDAGPSWRVIKSGFERRSQAEAFAIDWLRERGYSIIDRDVDAANDAIDMMTAKGDALYQYAIEAR